MRKTQHMKNKLLPFLMAAALLSLGSVCTAYAEEDYSADVHSITSVPLSLSWDKAPKGGDLVGNIYARSQNKQFTIEGAEYVKRDDTWDFGEQPVAEIELSAKSNYRFPSSLKDSITVSGCNAKYKSAEVDSDGSTLIIQVTLPEIAGRLPGTTAVGWNDTKAIWDAVPGASSYEIQLYRDGRLIKTESSETASCEFEEDIKEVGRYTFSVRAMGKYITQSSIWVAETEEPVIVEAETDKEEVSESSTDAQPEVATKTEATENTL